MSDSTKLTGRYAFELLSDQILRRIQSGEWPSGSKLPTVEAFTREYPESRVTINKALQLLVKKGVLSMRRGRGTYVEQSQVKRHYGLLIGPSLVGCRQSPFAALVAKHAKELFDEQGQGSKIYIEDPKLLYEGIPNLELRDDLQHDRLAGLITAHCDAPKTLDASPIWQAHAVPYVDLGSHQNTKYRVSYNGLQALELAFAYSARSKRRKIAIFSSSDPQRFEYINILAEKYGIYVNHDWNQGPGSAYSEEAGFVNMLALWQQKEKPDALLVCDDTVGKGVTQAMLKLGISHPKDLLLIICVNKDSNVFFPMPFVQIEYDAKKLIAESIQLLNQVIDNSNIAEKEILIEPVLRLENGGSWNDQQLDLHKRNL